MQIQRLLPATAALGAALVFSAANTSEAYSLIGTSLSLTQRDFRVFNNFSDALANNNQTADPNFPGAQGAVMAIWKACIEWGSRLHGTGGGDPTQPNGLGSGGANFDASFQGLASSPGNIGDNTHWELAGSNGGVLAVTTYNFNGDWTIHYYSTWLWDDGPGGVSSPSAFDIQAIAAHEYGHALGLGHSNISGATMAPSAAPGQTTPRSISADDIAGVQAIYGVADPNKPIISGVSLFGSQLTITGQNFLATGNTVWFTRQDFTGTGTPVTVTNVPSSGAGTQIIVAVPSTARSGDVLVRTNLSAGRGLSNAFPLDLTNTCPPPFVYCSTTPNSVGNGGVLTVFSTQNVAANDTFVVASAVPPGQFGIFLYGENQTVAFVGDGVLCIGGPFFRLPPQVIDGLGTAITAIDFPNLPPGGQIAQGESWNFQFWYRDPTGGSSGNNFTEAVVIPFCN